MGRLPAIFVVAALTLAACAAPAGAATFTVDNTGDATGGACDGAIAGDCSLRSAIENANVDSTSDTIAFSVGTSGIQKITLGSNLPAVSQPALIDGYTQPEAAANTQPNFTNAFSADGQGTNAAIRIEIDAEERDAFVLTGGGTTIRGLSIYDSETDAIRLASGGNVVVGNFIGPTAAGAAPTDDGNPGFPATETGGNERSGVYVESGTGNRIGGPNSADRNLISANTVSTHAGTGVMVVGGSDTSLQGNLIGTNAAGTAELGSVDAIRIQDDIILGAPANVTIGGTADRTGNLISGHASGSGTVNVQQGTGHEVLGNRIGTDITGLALVANNSFSNLRIDADGVQIGDGAGHGNLFAGSVSGIDMNGAGHTVQGNRIGTERTGTDDRGAVMGIQLSAKDSLIGGTDPGERNLISGNTAHGIGEFPGSAGNPDRNDIQGNYIGVDLAGTAKLPNGGAGIALLGGADTTIGGAAVGADNVIAGNDGPGVTLQPPEGTENDRNEVLGNKIGTDAAGTGSIPNGGPGVHVVSGRDNVIGRPGEGNLILNNGGEGVLVSGFEFQFGNDVADNDGNSIRGNSIFNNGRLGIDLVPDDFDFSAGGDGVTPNDAGDGDDGNNERQNYPVLNAVLPGASTFVRGVLDSSPSSAYTIDFYSTPACDGSGYGEGSTWLGATSTTTDPNGHAVWNTTLVPTVPLGEFVTATATSAGGDTSEFSACRESGTQIAEAAQQQQQQQASTTSDPPAQPAGTPCGDKRPPITTMRKAGVKLSGRGRSRKLVLSGRSADHRECPSGVQRVDVSLARVQGRTGVNCRFIRKQNRYTLTGRKNCRRPTLFRATGTDKFEFTFNVPLKPGLYRVQARGTDRARNKETPNKRRNIVFFSVR